MTTEKKSPDIIELNGVKYKKLTEPTEWEVVIPFHSMKKKDAENWHSNLYKIINGEFPNVTEVYLRDVNVEDE